VRQHVAWIVLLMLLIKGSHLGATPWDSYRDSLSIHQFEACHPRFRHPLLQWQRPSPRPSASLTGGLLGREAWARGVGPWCKRVWLELARGRSVA